MGSVYDRDQRAAEALALEAARLGDSGLAPALYTYDELITECSFSGKKCSEWGSLLVDTGPWLPRNSWFRADFVSFRDPIYGACYSFNEDSSLNYSTNRAGMMFGLKLLLTVNVSFAQARSVMGNALCTRGSARITFSARKHGHGDRYSSYDENGWCEDCYPP